MKGDVVSLLAVFGIAVITTMIFGGTMFNVLFGTTYSYMEVLKEKHLISAINQLNFAKLAAVNALRYSLFQATFEKASNGFCGDNLCYGVYWRVYSDTDKAPIIDNVDTSIGNRTIEIFNEYTTEIERSFTLLDDYTLSLPTLNPNSNELVITHNDFVELNISTTKKMKKFVGIGEGSYITQDFNFSIREYLPIVRMFTVGRKLFVENDLVKNAINYAINNLPQKCKKVEKTFCESEEVTCPICEFVEVEEECKEKFKEKFKNYITKKFYEEANKKEFSISTSIVDIYYLIDATCQNLGCAEDQNCGIKACKKYENETCVEYEYYQSNTMSCTYSWKIAVDTKITISTKDAKYPVHYEGNTEWRKLPLSFRIKSGNSEAEERFKETGEIYVKNLIC